MARVEPHLSSLGITRIANVTGLDRIGIPVAVASRPNSRGISVSQGKGLDQAAARASAVMEAIEGHHAERVQAPLRYARYEELAAEVQVTEPRTLVRTSRPFDPHANLLWTEGHDLVADEPTWVPHELVHSDFTLPRPPGAGFFVASTNGLASGNHVVEAVCHGLCEVIERDATASWHELDAVARERTRVVPESVDDPDCLEVLDRYASAGIDVGLWESTAGTAVPSYVCVIADPAPEGFSAIGMGCHPTRHIALLRALTEAAQGRLTVITGSREDIGRASYRAGRVPERATLDQQLLRGETPTRRFGDAPGFDSDDFGEDLEWLLACLTAAGHTQVVVVDLTRSTPGIPVVRVVVPGMAL